MTITTINRGLTDNKKNSETGSIQEVLIQEILYPFIKDCFFFFLRRIFVDCHRNELDSPGQERVPLHQKSRGTLLWWCGCWDILNNTTIPNEYWHVNTMCVKPPCEGIGQKTVQKHWSFSFLRRMDVFFEKKNPWNSRQEKRSLRV